MRIAAIIAEYNPFHTGHMHHIERTRALSGADYVIAVMGGNLTQRGETAALEKRDRAAAALRCGVDAVIELPGLFAVRSAEVFARAGVRLAEAAGADVLSFGCETADIGWLDRVLDAEAEAREQIGRLVGEGETYARARGEAVAAVLGVPSDRLNRPNTALALEYLRALRAAESRMEPLAVERRDGYHDLSLERRFPSASALRAAAEAGRDVRRFLPGLAPDARWMPPMAALDPVLMYALREYTPDTLREICDISEGLEYRVCKLSTRCVGRMQLIDELKCKRYTFARLSRVLAQAACHVTKRLCEAHPGPEYIRLIGARRDAGPLLKEISRRAALPLVSSGAEIRENGIFECECRMTDFFMLLSEDRRAGLEYTAPFVSIE